MAQRTGPGDGDKQRTLGVRSQRAACTEEMTCRCHPTGNAGVYRIARVWVLLAPLSKYVAMKILKVMVLARGNFAKVFNCKGRGLINEISAFKNGSLFSI